MIRRMKCRIALVLCLVLAASLAVTPATAQERTRFELEMNLWDQDVTGQIKIVEQGIGDTIDLGGDLGLSGDTVSDVRVTFHPSRRTEIRFARVPISYSGDQIASRSIEFAGQTFTVSSRVVSELNLDYYRAGFAWQFLSSDDGRFRAGPLLELKGFDGDASLAAPDLVVPVSVSETFEAAFGSAGIAIDLEPTDRVHVFGEFSTLVGTDVGDQTDLEVGVRVVLWGPLTAQAGFRSMTIDYLDNDDEINFDMDGVFFGAGLRF